MSPKQIIALVVAIVALAISTWKGPGAWGATSAGITALCLLILPLLRNKPQISEYVTDVEDALEKEQPGKIAEMRRARKLPPRSTS